MSLNDPPLRKQVPLRLSTQFLRRSPLAFLAKRTPDSIANIARESQFYSSSDISLAHNFVRFFFLRRVYVLNRVVSGDCEM